MQIRFDRSASIIIVLLLALGAGYVGFVFVPQHRALGKLSADLATQRDYIDRTGDLVPAVQAVQQELEQTNAYNTKWQEHTPDERQLAALFGEISGLAKESGITTTRFNPDPIVAYDRIRKIPLTVGCKGTFSQVEKFLCGLEALPQAIWIEHVSIEKQPQDKENVSCEASLVIFADNPDNSDQVKPSG